MSDSDAGYSGSSDTRAQISLNGSISSMVVIRDTLSERTHSVDRARLSDDESTGYERDDTAQKIDPHCQPLVAGPEE